MALFDATVNSGCRSECSRPLALAGFYYQTAIVETVCCQASPLKAVLLSVWLSKDPKHSQSRWHANRSVLLGPIKCG